MPYVCNHHNFPHPMSTISRNLFNNLPKQITTDDHITSIAYSMNSTKNDYLAIGSEGKVEIWDTRNITKVHSLELPRRMFYGEGGVPYVESANPYKLAYGWDQVTSVIPRPLGNEIILWNPNTGNKSSLFVAGKGSVYCVDIAFGKNNTLIGTFLIGTEDEDGDYIFKGQIYVWDINTHELIRTTILNNTNISNATYGFTTLAGLGILAISGYELEQGETTRNIFLFNPHTGERLQTLDIGENWSANHLAWGPMGHLTVSSIKSPTDIESALAYKLSILDPRSGNIIKNIFLGTQGISDFSWGPQSILVAPIYDYKRDRFSIQFLNPDAEVIQNIVLPKDITPEPIWSLSGNLAIIHKNTVSIWWS